MKITKWQALWRADIYYSVEQQGFIYYFWFDSPLNQYLRLCYGKCSDDVWMSCGKTKLCLITDTILNLPGGSEKTTKYFSQIVRSTSCNFKPGQPECVVRINQINHRISLNINKFPKARCSQKGHLTTLCLERFWAFAVVQLMSSLFWDVSRRNVSEERKPQLLNFFLCHDRSQTFGFLTHWDQTDDTQERLSRFTIILLIQAYKYKFVYEEPVRVGFVVDKLTN